MISCYGHSSVTAYLQRRRLEQRRAALALGLIGVALLASLEEVLSRWTRQSLLALLDENSLTLPVAKAEPRPLALSGHWRGSLGPSILASLDSPAKAIASPPCLSEGIAALEVKSDGS